MCYGSNNFEVLFSRLARSRPLQLYLHSYGVWCIYRRECSFSSQTNGWSSRSLKFGVRVLVQPYLTFVYLFLLWHKKDFDFNVCIMIIDVTNGFSFVSRANARFHRTENGCISLTRFCLFLSSSFRFFRSRSFAISLLLTFHISSECVSHSHFGLCVSVWSVIQCASSLEITCSRKFVAMGNRMGSTWLTKTFKTFIAPRQHFRRRFLVFFYVTHTKCEWEKIPSIRIAISLSRSIYNAYFCVWIYWPI